MSIKNDEYPELTVGTWVHARTIEGHIVSGYIEKRDDEGDALITVSHACCEHVGNFTWAHTCDCEPMGDSKMTDTDGYLLNMIDIALQERDKDQFMYFSHLLRKLNDAPNYRSAVIAVRIR